MQQQTDHIEHPQAHQEHHKPNEHGAIAVQHFHTHSIPLDMEDIERDWDKPIAEAGIAAKASVIVRVGLLDLSAGTGSFRVREMMHRIAYPLGVHVRADVNLTDIEAACTDGKDRITEVIDLPTTGVNTERIWLLEHFADWFSVNLGEESMYHKTSEVSRGLMRHLDVKDASQLSADLSKRIREEQKERQAEAQEAEARHDQTGSAAQEGQDAVLDALEEASRHTDPGRPLAEQLDVHETDWSQSAMTESLAARAEVAEREEQEIAEQRHRHGVEGGQSDSEVMGVDFTELSDRLSDEHGREAERDASSAAARRSDDHDIHGGHGHAGRHGAAPDDGFISSAATDRRGHAHKPPKGEYAAHFDHVGKSPVSGRPGITVRQAHQRLDMIERRKPLYSPAFAGLASAIACASFVFLLGGGPYDMIGAFVGAGLGHWLRRRLFKHHLNQFFVTFVCVAVAALACTGTLRLIGLFDPVALQHDTAYIGAMLFVIPGFPLITSGLDMAKIDFPSGIQRLMYFLCIVLMATLAG